MLAIQKRREERLAAEALEQKLKDDAQAIIDEENKKNKEANEAARKKLEEDIAKGIVPQETKIDPDADLDNLTREEQLLLFGENHVEQKDMTAQQKITYAVLGVFGLAALILIILAIAGVFDEFLINPCWEPPKQVRQTFDYYNTSVPLPGEEDSLIETWITTPNYDYRAYPLPFDWCNKKYHYYDPTTKKNANYIKKDAKYLWGRYYINHGANDACFVTHTIVLDSMCTDPALLPNRTEVAPTKMTAPSPSTSTTKNATANKGPSKKRDVPLKDPCWLTIQGETEINRAHWDWEAQQHAIRNSNGGRRERALKVANAGAQDTSSSSSPDPFVPSLSTTCESHEIATTKRGVGGLPQPVCVSPRLTTTTVLDGGGVKQLFHITTGAKLSIRNLILRNFKATGNCFCKKPHNTCGGGAIFITNRNSHLFANNIIFQANKAWIGGAIFGADKASVSLVSTDIVYNIAKNNGTRMCKGGGYGGGLYLLNSTAVTTICTNILSNEAGDSGGGVMMQKGSKLTAIKSSILNNKAKLNVYYDKLDSAKRIKEFSLGEDIRYYQTCSIRAVQNSQIEENKVYPFIDVESSVYTEMYYEGVSEDV